MDWGAWLWNLMNSYQPNYSNIPQYGLTGRSGGLANQGPGPQGMSWDQVQMKGNLDTYGSANNPYTPWTPNTVPQGGVGEPTSREDNGSTISGDISAGNNPATGLPWNTPSQTGSTVDPNAAMLAALNAQTQAATQYQQEQMDLANRRFAWEQQQAQAATQQAQQAREGSAVQDYNKMVLDYMSKNPITGAAVARGFFAPGGQADSVIRPESPDLMAYYQQHPELGPAPGTGAAPIGYSGSASLGGDQFHMQVPTPVSGPAQQIGKTAQGSIGINLPDFMYNLRTPNGTPVPLGPQQEAQMQGSNNQNANAFQDYVGNYAGFNPEQLLSDSVGVVGGGIKGASNFTDPTMNGVQF